MGLIDVVKSLIGRKDRISDFRPAELDVFTRGLADVARLPTIPFTGMKFCFRDDVEILTEDGWKLFKDLKDEKVATLNPETGEVMYVQPKEKIAYYYEGKLLEYDSGSISFSVIPEHMMMVKTHNDLFDSSSNKRKPEHGWKFIQAKDLKQNVYYVKKDFGVWKGKEVEQYVIPAYDVVYKNLGKEVIKKREEKIVAMDDWLRFLGWFLSEGCVNKRGVVLISQKCFKEEVEEVLKKIGFKWRYNQKSNQYVCYSIQLASWLLETCYRNGVKRIPRYVYELSPRQMRIFLDAFWKGDGALASSGTKTYYPVSKELADDLQELILKSGGYATLNVRHVRSGFSDETIIYEVSEWKRSGYGVIQTEKIKEVQYQGMVYCVNVEPYHTIFVRRNGRTLWTGNCYDMYYYSDLLRTIIRALVGETFRNGLTISRNFVVKCVNCGTEYQTQVNRCDVCGSDSLRQPDRAQYEFLRKWIEDVNLNDQTLIEVLKEIDEDLNIVDNAFICVLKDYYFNENGDLVGAKPVEVLRMPPDKTHFVMDRIGRFARTDDGKMVMFCLKHRNTHHIIDPEKAEDARCPVCGKKMFPAYYRVWRGTAGKDSVYYTNGEVLHIKKFTQGIGYGMPPVYTIWMKLMILLKQDFFILTAYHLQRPPKGILVIRGNRESIDRAWRRMMKEAETNPHMIYPLTVEPSKEAKQVMEWLDLTVRSNDIDFTGFRDEVRRTCGALYGVMPIFTGEPGGYGLGNEGLQVVVTNRAVEMEQTLFNEKVLPWLCKSIGITDWTLQLIPSEARDIVGRLQREQLRIQNAQAMANLGYKPVAFIGEDGLDFYFVEPETGEEIPKKQSMEFRPPRMRRSTRWMQRFEGEPFHGRPKTEGQRYEGELTGVRRPKVEGEASVSDIFQMSAPDDFSWADIPLEDGEVDVIKEVWGKAVKSHFYGSERYPAALEGDYWEQYAGLSKRKSSKINGIILMNILNKNYRKDAIVDQIVNEVGVDKQKAELIVETEFANIMNLARELAYKERTKVKKFVRVLSKEPCEVCKRIAERCKDGVTLEEMKQIIKEEAGETARGYLAHPRCKCSFRRAYGEKAWWE